MVHVYVCLRSRRHRLTSTWEVTGRLWWHPELCCWRQMLWVSRELSDLTCCLHVNPQSLNSPSLLIYRAVRNCFWSSRRRTTPTLVNCWTNASSTPGCNVMSPNWGKWYSRRILLRCASTWRTKRGRGWLGNGQTTCSCIFSPLMSFEGALSFLPFCRSSDSLYIIVSFEVQTLDQSESGEHCAEWSRLISSAVITPT